VTPWAWPPAIILLAAGGVLVWCDPRRLTPALAFTALLFWVGGWAFLLVMDLAGRVDREMGPVWALLGFVGASMLAVVVLGVFLVWNTVEMTRREGRRLPALVTGVVGLGILAYVATAVLGLVANDPVIIVWLMLLGLPIGYVAFMFTAFLLYSTAYGVLTRRFGRPVDAVVVLGAGLIRGERVSPLLAARLDLGRRHYERSRAAGRETVIITSGGQGPDEKLSEAEAMARYLVDAGVDPEHVLKEDRSTDTRENLEFSSAVLEGAAVTGDIAVATNNYHAFRSATLMRTTGIPGYSIGAPTARYYWPSATVREFLALLRDNLVVNLVILVLLSAPLLVFAATWVLRMLSQ